MRMRHKILHPRASFNCLGCIKLSAATQGARTICPTWSNSHRNPFHVICTDFEAGTYK